MFDEVLTMSARMAAATGDFSYQTRYDKYDAELDALIKKTARALGLSEVKQFVEQTDEANQKLVQLERRAFALMHEGRRPRPPLCWSAANIEGGSAPTPKALIRLWPGKMAQSSTTSAIFIG